MKKTLVATLGMALLLGVAPIAAAQHHGGGSHSGGGRSFGHSFSGGRFGGFHRGFRGGARFGFGWGWGWGWGWPWGYWGLYAPYDYAPYGDYVYGYDAPARRWAAIDTDVSPDEARVYLDGRYIGTADDFDGYPDYLYLGPGHYRLEFRLEGFETKTVDVDARPGTKTDIKDKLHKIPGAKQYGSYDTPEVPGGIQRFFVKRRGESAAPYSPRDRDRDDVRPDDRYRDRDVAPRDDRYTPDDSGDSWAAPGNDRSPDANVRPDDGSHRDRPSADRPRSSEDWRGRPSRGGRGDAARTRLMIHAAPPDAAVYVDDRFVGTAEEVGALDRGVKVSAGNHTVTVSRPGYREKTVRVDVEEGGSRSVDFDLQR